VAFLHNCQLQQRCYFSLAVAFTLCISISYSSLILGTTLLDSSDMVLETKRCIICIHNAPLGLVAWLSGNAFDSINEVTLRQAGLVQ